MHVFFNRLKSSKYKLQTKDSVLHCLTDRFMKGINLPLKMLSWRGRKDANAVTLNSRASFTSDTLQDQMDTVVIVIFWSTSGLTHRTFDGPGFSAEGTLLSASEICHYRMKKIPWTERVISRMVFHPSHTVRVKWYGFYFTVKTLKPGSPLTHLHFQWARNTPSTLWT